MTPPLPDRIACVVLGAGHAGLAASYELTRRSVPHVVLERGRIGETWRSKRWDAFTMIMPNWGMDLPGFPYEGDRDAFSTRDEGVARFEAYARSFGAPVRSGVTVHAIEPAPDNDATWPFLVRTDHGDIRATTTIVATGIYQVPRSPWFAALLPPDIMQLDPDHYRNPESLPDGATLVVGSGASGTQIAEDLLLAGRRVYLAVGRAGRQPRRYRGIDSSRWNRYPGVSGANAGDSDSGGGGAARSGRGGGDTDTNLHRFARDGMTLVGHITGQGATSGTLSVAPDLHETLRWIDAFDYAWRERVDALVESKRAEIEVETSKTITPPHGRPDDGLRDGFDLPERTELDLEAEGITSIVWAIGYDTDYSVVRFPVIGTDGHPVHDGGITPVQGLYFVGMTFRGDRPKSSFIGIVGPEAAAVADDVCHRVREAGAVPRIDCAAD